MRIAEEVDRRGFAIALSAFAGSVVLVSAVSANDPWSAAEFMDPAELAARMKRSEKQRIVSVAFPVLYRQRHITGAVFAGPGSKPEGLTSMKDVLPKQTSSDLIVLYCGCCPMDHCPNIRPAYTEAKRLGFSNVRVLNIPTNLHTDWIAKGFPVEG